MASLLLIRDGQGCGLTGSQQGGFTVEKLHFHNLPPEGRMPKAGLGQSPRLEEYPCRLVHQLPQQLLQNGVTGLVPGVNNQCPMEEVAWVHVQFLLCQWTAPPSQRNSVGWG